MTARQTFENCRRSEVIRVEAQNVSWLVSFSRFDDGSIGELFISVDGQGGARVGSPAEALARDLAVVVSFALQYGAPINAIASALTVGHDGEPMGLLGVIFEAISKDPQDGERSV